MASSSQRANLVAQVVQEHRAVSHLFEQFDLYDDTSAVHLKEELFEQISRALSTHAAAEEQVIYPVVRAKVPGGEALADTALRDHREVAETLLALARVGAEDQGFVVGVKALAASVHRHVADEERDLLPLLENHLDPNERDEVARAFGLASSVAPTRPHPGMPERPPANVVVGLATSLVDRVRDVLDSAADRGRKLVEDFEKDHSTRT
jgi:hemerythrin superfamily protein